MWFAAGELGRAKLSCWVASSFSVYLIGTVVLQLFVACSHVHSTSLLQACGVNHLYWQGKHYLFSLNKGNASCRVRVSAALGVWQKYLPTVNWSTAKARRFSQLGAQKRCFVADKVADWFISNSLISFLGLTLLQWIFLRCFVITFIL